MTTFMDEITEAVKALRQQHEIEVSQATLLEQYMEAHSADLIARIQAIREREAFRRADVARELVQLATEIGVLPPPSQAVITHNTPSPIRMPNCIARSASEDLARSIN